jgi:hypothetical protein
MCVLSYSFSLARGMGTGSGASATTASPFRANLHSLFGAAQRALRFAGIFFQDTFCLQAAIARDAARFLFDSACGLADSAFRSMFNGLSHKTSFKILPQPSTNRQMSERPGPERSVELNLLR